MSFGVTPISRARIRATLVLPVPLPPENKYACAIFLFFIEASSTRTTRSCPRTSPHPCGLYMRYKVACRPSFLVILLEARLPSPEPTTVDGRFYLKNTQGFFFFPPSPRSGWGGRGGPPPVKTPLFYRGSHFRL